MLDGIRNKAQSWGIKVIFGIIIIVFVFWGVSNPGGMRAGVLASINGETITVPDFNKVMQQAAQAELRRAPDLLSNEQTFTLFKRMVLESMVTQTLLRQEGARLGIVVTPHEIKTVISAWPVFQNEAGKFDPERYKRVLDAERTSPGAFEADMYNRMLVEKVMRYVNLSGGLNEAEAKVEYSFVLEKRTADFVLFSPEEYKDSVSVSDEELGAYYDASQERLRLPARYALEFLRLTPDTLAKGYAVTDEEAEEYYHANSASFHQPESFESRHIFIACPPDDSVEEGAADRIAKAKVKLAEVEALLAKGDDFAAVASTHSEDRDSASIGGMLGWIERGRSGSSEFDNAALALAPGAISEPVRTPYGFHIIKLENKKEEATAPFADVKQEIVAMLSRDKADQDFKNVQQAAEDGLNMNTPFADLAEKFHVKTDQTELAPQEELDSTLGLHSDSRQILFDALAAAVASGEPSTIPIPLNVKDGIALVRITNSRPSEIPPLADVRDSILATLRDGKAESAAREAADKALGVFSGKEDIPEGYAEKVQQSKDVHRIFPVVEPLGEAGPLVDALFNAPQGTWLPNLYETPKGPVIARLASKRVPSEEEWEQYKGIYMAQGKQRREQDVLEAFTETLRNKGKVEISLELLDSLKLR